MNNSESVIYAFTFCPFKSYVSNTSLTVNTLEDFVKLGLVPEVELKEITKEEFYTL